MTLIFLSFFAGIISFLSPCVLPLIPGYLSFICGTDLENLKKQSKYFIVKKSALFVIGFSIIFILLGASSTFFGTFLLKQSQIFNDNNYIGDCDKIYELNSEGILDKLLGI